MEHILYFDLETKYSADEVGGWGNIEDMGMSVGVIWDDSDNQFHVYIEHQIQEMVDHFCRADQIVGFNHVGFDYRVVAGVHHADTHQRSQLYTKLAGLNNFDMLFELKKLLGHRLKLESIARPTLGTGKSADGMQALKWYKEGKLDKIIGIKNATKTLICICHENFFLFKIKDKGIKKIIAKISCIKELFSPIKNKTK